MPSSTTKANLSVFEIVEMVRRPRGGRDAVHKLTNRQFEPAARERSTFDACAMARHPFAIVGAHEQAGTPTSGQLRPTVFVTAVRLLGNIGLKSEEDDWYPARHSSLSPPRRTAQQKPGLDRRRRAGRNHVCLPGRY
jgi:hypothetical protein